MSISSSTHKINQLKNRYLLFRWIEICLLSASCILIAWLVSMMFTNFLIFKLVFSFGIGLAIAVWRVLSYRLFSFSKQKFITYLNSHYPQLEESADLFLIEHDSLSGLQQLQAQRVTQRFDSLYPEIKIPNAIPQSTGIFVISLVGYILLASFVTPLFPTKNKKLTIDVSKVNPTVEKGAVTVNNIVITVTPPAYTKSRSTESISTDIKVPEGSNVLWSVQFSDSIKTANLLLAGNDSVNFIAKKNSYQANLFISTPSFYQLQWNDGKLHTSDYFKIEVIKDESPKISITSLSQFTKVSFVDQLTLPLKATLSDDYGLTNASIIATVSKGSGESVKFREEKLRFENPINISGKQVTASRTFNVSKLGMEPGDELYFYVEAWDNKTPTPNYSRTETFFIALQDTTKQETVEDEGLGVDLMPEYFRSQRQIIIDTEKLLKERKKKSVHEFKSTSNELGYDQKVLRLKYGQFLGEEFVGQIGPASVEVYTDERTEDVAAKFGHVHDKENEHNLLADKKESPTHSHESEKKGEEENPLEAFAHNHDSGEEATFFVQSVRAKLKAALAVMWDAELYLRLYEPAKSLPYQYTALKLLKEISNDSRIYVHRTGFDPPPLKEEKRLTADLSEIKNASNKTVKAKDELYQEIRKALTLVELLLSEQSNLLTAQNKNQFRKAAQELAVVAVEQPARYLRGLSILKKLIDNKTTKKEVNLLLSAIRPILSSVLPSEPASPSKNKITVHALDQQFLKSLEELKHD